MNNEELVELITKEVMTRLKAMLSKDYVSHNKKVLVLERSEDLCPVLTGALRENNYTVDSLDNMGSLNSYEGIILQSLSPKELANLAHGIGGCAKEIAVIDAILGGNRIYSMKKGLQHENFASTANKEFFNLYKSYENKLRSYGVAYVGLRELLGYLSEETTEIEKDACILEERAIDKAISQQCINDEFVDLTKKKLISEVELRNIYKNGINKVLVSKKSIVTPLAMDYARVTKVQIIKK